MVVLGYFALLFMGVTLGLIGSGGAILTIPILIYLFHVPIILATTYSLAIVGVTALFAGVQYRKNILFRKSIYFAVSSVLGVFLTRAYILDYLPKYLGGMSLEKAFILLLVIFMSLSSYFMLQDIKLNADTENKPTFFSNLKISLLGFALGLVMGLLGAGGGFLIVPVLVLLLKLSMQESVATSLFIITMNSLTGFISDKQEFLSKDGENILLFSGIALIGALLGVYLNKKVSSHHLKKIFAWFILLTAALISIKEFFI